MNTTSKIISRTLLITCFVVLLFVALHGIYRSLPARGAAQAGQAYNSITLKIGDKSVIVVLLQRALIKDGYLSSTPTGYFGPRTQAAVEAIQKANNLPVNGYVTIATSSLSSIFSTAAPAFTPITMGATGIRTTAIQKFLIARGYLKIATTTGYFGAITKAAVMAFQASSSIPQTGVIDAATFTAMNRR